MLHRVESTIPQTIFQSGLGARTLLHPPPACFHPVWPQQGTHPWALLHPRHQCQFQGLGRQHQGGCWGSCLQPLPAAGCQWLSGINSTQDPLHIYFLLDEWNISTRASCSLAPWSLQRLPLEVGFSWSPQLLATPACLLERTQVHSLFEENLPLTRIVIQKWSSPWRLPLPATPMKCPRYLLL